MYEIKYDPVFKADFRRVIRLHPHLLPEFKAAVDELAASGTVPSEYNPHELKNLGGNSSPICIHYFDARP